MLTGIAIRKERNRMFLKRMVMASVAVGLLASPVIAGTANAAVHSPGHSVSGSPAARMAAPLASAPETFRNESTGRCIDDVPLEALDCTGEVDQQWLVTVLSDGTRMLQNVIQGDCLAASGAHGILAETCDTRVTAERWIIQRRSDGSIGFQNDQTKGCAQDTVQTQLRMTGCDGSASESWQ
jgi:hypothetical protein